MKFFNLLKISYYFDSNLSYAFPGIWTGLGILVGLILVSFYLRKKQRHLFQHRLTRKAVFHLYNSSLWLGFGGLFWLFFRFESIRFLNIRLWPTLLVLYFLGSVIYAVYFLRFRYPKLAKARGLSLAKGRFLKMAKGRKRR